MKHKLDKKSYNELLVITGGTHCIGLPEMVSEQQVLQVVVLAGLFFYFPIFTVHHPSVHLLPSIQQGSMLL